MKRLTNEEFINKANSVHDDKYDYTLCVYKNKRTKVHIICETHGSFYQTPDSHVNQKSGCPKCGISNGGRLNNDSFILKAKSVHGDKYGYKLVKYTYIKNKVEIECKKHGIFIQSPNDHFNGCGCPSCSESKGEKEIREYLINSNVIFESQKKFEKCKNQNYLPYDFYLPNNNLLIEFDGEQHFKSYKIFGGEKGFKLRQKNDMIKSNFAKNYDIELLRIPYYEKNNIKNILKQKI